MARPGTARRRFDTRMKKKKALRLFRRMFPDMAPDELWKMASKYADNMAACSCMMCGNPRKQLGIAPIQEQRLDAHDAMDEEEALSA